MSKYIAIFLICFLNGCTATYHAQDYYKKLKIQYDVRLSVEDKNELLKNLKIIADFWKWDNKSSIPNATVRIIDEKRFKLGKIWAYGLFDSRFNQIMVIAGKNNTIPSLYHELCHAAFARHDVKHVNPNWPKWKKRAREIYRLMLRH